LLKNAFLEKSSQYIAGVLLLLLPCFIADFSLHNVAVSFWCGHNIFGL